MISELKPHPHQNLVPAMSDTEYGDLLKDIKQNGILQPIDITYENVILDGHHRFKAAKELGIKEVEVRVPELIDISADEYLISVALNRRHLSEGQKAVLANEYRKVISEMALKERGLKGALVTNKSLYGIDDERLEADVSSKRIEEQERSRKLAAEHMHVSEWKVREVQEMEKKAETEPMAKVVYEKLRSGDLQIHEARAIIKQPEEKRAVILQRKEEEPGKDIRVIVREVSTAEKNNSPPPVPTGKYSVIYADPPWEYEHPISTSREIENQYPTMPIEEIKSVNIPADDNSIIFLWVTSPMLEKGLEVMNAWGFTYRTNMVWVKDKIGMGWYVRQQHELLLIGVRGDGIGMPLPENKPSSVVTAPRGEHSSKPFEMYNLIEKMYPNHTRIELFARNRRDGWDSWGNDV